MPDHNDDPLKESGISTRAVDGGTAPDPATGARITPINQTASYAFEEPDHAARFLLPDTATLPPPKFMGLPLPRLRWPADLFGGPY